MPLVLPEHQSIIIQDPAHGQGKEDGSQVWSSYKQRCLVKFCWLLFCFDFVVFFFYFHVIKLYILIELKCL